MEHALGTLGPALSRHPERLMRRAFGASACSAHLDCKSKGDDDEERHVVGAWRNVALMNECDVARDLVLSCVLFVNGRAIMALACSPGGRKSRALICSHSVRRSSFWVMASHGSHFKMSSYRVAKMLALQKLLQRCSHSVRKSRQAGQDLFILLQNGRRTDHHDSGVVTEAMKNCSSVSPSSPRANPSIPSNDEDLSTPTSSPTECSHALTISFQKQYKPIAIHLSHYSLQLSQLAISYHAPKLQSSRSTLLFIHFHLHSKCQWSNGTVHPICAGQNNKQSQKKAH